MISVPDSIKEKLHLDHCQKNIRIHFPNGERSDICNDLIVKDSVSFTESLCSQDTLKFGLCEASVFECETVGVGNIKGATIEVSCEVYCETQTTGAKWQADLQAWVYPIPYGVFYVDSCQRQGDIQHRKIVAYGGTATLGGKLSPIMSQIMACPFQSASEIKYNQNGLLFALANTCCYDFSDDDFDITSCAVPVTFTNWLGAFNTETDYRIEFFGTSKQWDQTQPVYRDSLFRIRRAWNRENIKSIINIIQENWGALYKTNESLIFKVLCRTYLGSNIQTDQAVSYSQDPITFYPWADTSYTQYVYLSFPTYLDYVVVKSGQTIIDTLSVNLDICDSYSFDMISAKNNEWNIGSIKFDIVKNGEYYYTVDTGEYDNLDSISQVIELHGCFGEIDRSGQFKLLNIRRQFGLTPGAAVYPGANVYPQSVTGGRLLPQDYQSCWYDDEYSKPFGLIKCQYKNTNNEDVLFLYYLTGYDADSDVESYRTYDLSNNEIIKSYLWTQNDIQDICQTLAANIEGVTYMPVEFVGRGLPHVEAGDTFEILTKSNDSITTIVLNRTLSGEQTLTDAYKSV